MKNVRYILSAALALAGFASCDDENIVSETAESQQGKQQMMTFTVNAPNVGDTRSQLDENGKSVVFNADDAINVFIDYDTQFKFTTSEGGSVATFTGIADAADQYYFLSPYQSTAKGNRGTVYANLPSVQQAVSGSYDPNAMISVGEGTNTDQITLRQACALIKIKIAETLDGVQRIYLNGDEPLAGRLYIITNSGAIDYISDTEYQIALNGPFVAGSTYYICVPPQNLGKLTVSYTTATAVYERTAVNPLTAVAGHIYDFGEIDDTNYSISTQARILKKPSFGKYSSDCVVTKIHIECEYAGELPTAEVSGECRTVGGIGCNTIWEVYDRNSNTLYIRTKASSILMPSACFDFFRGYEYVNTITGLEKLDTRNVIEMTDMFRGCVCLTNVSGISNWDVTNVQLLNAMFRDCERLETLDLSGWNTSNLTTMTDMYMNCYKLSTLKLGENFTLDNIQQKRWMFSDASRDTANGLTIYGVTDDAVKAKLKDDTDWDDDRMKFSGSQAPLNGRFSVSSTEMVCFAPGNIQYQASTGLWRFANHQYSFVGNAPGNSEVSNRETQLDRIDWFGWGATGCNVNGALPYDISFNNSHFKTEASASGSESLTIDNAADWGYAYNSTCGDQGWFTMSWSQWDYLLNTRSASTIGGVSNARFAKVAVNGVHGLLLFPDSFTWNTATMSTEPTNINSETSTWSTDYTIAQFEAMEDAGVVFIPASGYRGQDDGIVSDYGAYWTSDAYNAERAVSFDFDSSKMQSYNTNRSTCCAVRLVKYAS